MSSPAAFYFLLHVSMSHSKYSWRREYLKLTLGGKRDRLESVVEYEDKTCYRPLDLAFGLPTGTRRSTKLEYTQALLRYRKDAAERRRLAELEKQSRKQMQEGLDIARGFKPARATPAPLLVAAPVATDPHTLFDDFTIVDTEYQGDYLLEVAAVRYQNWQEVDRFVSFVRFTDWVWPRISETTGIYARHVERAPLEKVVLQKFIDLAGDSLLIAHNSSADRSKLEHACRRQGQPMLANKWFCTLALARARLPKKTPCGLTELCDRFKFGNKDAHRALSDVLRTFQVLRHFQQEDPILSLDPKVRKAAPQLFPA